MDISPSSAHQAPPNPRLIGAESPAAATIDRRDVDPDERKRLKRGAHAPLLRTGPRRQRGEPAPVAGITILRRTRLRAERSWRAPALLRGRGGVEPGLDHMDDMKIASLQAHFDETPRPSSVSGNFARNNSAPKMSP